MVVMAGDIELRREALPAAEPGPEHVPWQRALALFLDARADSPHTRRAYERHVRTAMGQVGVHAVSQLTGELLASHRVTITSSELAPGSQSQALAALRSFLRWARTMGLHRLSDDVLRETLRTPKADVRRPYQVLSEAEIGRVLAAANGNARDRAMLAVLLGAGLRAAELAGADVADLHEDADGNLALHVRGKGRRERIVPLRPEIARVVRSYLASTGRHLGGHGPLYLSGDPARRRADRRMSTRAVGYLIDKLCDRAGVEAKRISPHSCRHTFAIRALRGGANVVAVQKLLGHANAATTSRYLDHLELDELRAAMPELPVDEDEAA